MAIKPSLIEQAVLAVGLPAVIPATEPPLGVTMQLLLALGMAGLGGLLGALLARWLARPKVQKKQRRRDPTAALTSSGVGTGQSWAAGEYAESNAAARRRQLAMEEDTSPVEHHDRAPVPGQSRQVLDVTEFDLEGFESKESDTIQEFVPDEDNHASASLDEAFGQPVSEESEVPAEINPFDDVASDSADFDTEVEPEIEPVGQIAFESTGQDVREVAADEDEPESASDFDLLQESLANDTFADELADSAGKSADSFDGDHQHVIQTVADGTEGRAFDPVGEGRRFDVAEAFRPEAAAAVADVAEDSRQSHAVAHPVHADTGEDAQEPASGIAASRIMTASLDRLSHAELLERLALTLERSRSRPSDAGPNSAASQPAVRASAIEVSANNAAAPDQDQPQVAASCEAAAEAVVPIVPDEPSSEQVSQPPVPVIPAALRPIVFEEEGEADQLPSVVPPRQFSMSYQTSSRAHASQASEFTEETSAEFGRAAVEPAISTASDKETLGIANDTEQESDAAGVEQELEEGYSSLLSLSRSDRQKFVRIEEPELDEGEVKPFVVFPGDNSAELGPFARPAAASEPQADAQAAAVVPEWHHGDERRFDQPEESGKSVSQTIEADLDHDPEETERSLKAALATLQRMSGAA